MSLIRLIVLICAGFLPALGQSGLQSLEFAHLEEFLKSGSPKWKMLGQETDMARAEGDIDLQWSNFSFDYDLEKVSNSESRITESTFGLTKNFEMPWIFIKRNAMWDDRFAAANSLREDQWNMFMADMKAGYVELALLEEQTQILEHIRTVLQNIAGTAQVRHAEGSLSGLEQNLIRMALFTTEAEISELNQRHINLAAQWKLMAGIDPDIVLQLPTAVRFKGVSKEIEQADFDRFEQNPRLTAADHTRLAARKMLEIEEMKIFPDLTVSGGYKQITDQFEGYVLSLSVPLPLLNQNRAQVFRQRSELARSITEYDLIRARIRGQINAQKQAVLSIESTLSNHVAEKQGDFSNLDQISLSYKEGWLSLNDMLNSIKVYYDYIQSYNQQLLKYYQSIFVLEALTGQDLISL